jgi:hypothetical protein
VATNIAHAGTLKVISCHYYIMFQQIWQAANKTRVKARAEIFAQMFPMFP